MKSMKAQQKLRRLTQRLKMTDRYIKKNKKYGSKEMQSYRFGLQTKIINATMANKTKGGK